MLILIGSNTNSACNATPNAITRFAIKAANAGLIGEVAVLNNPLAVRLLKWTADGGRKQNKLDVWFGKVVKVGTLDPKMPQGAHGLRERRPRTN